MDDFQWFGKCHECAHRYGSRRSECVVCAFSSPQNNQKPSDFGRTPSFYMKLRAVTLDMSQSPRTQLKIFRVVEHVSNCRRLQSAPSCRISAWRGVRVFFVTQYRLFLSRTAGITWGLAGSLANFKIPLHFLTPPPHWSESEYAQSNHSPDSPAVSWTLGLSHRRPG